MGGLDAGGGVMESQRGTHKRSRGTRRRIGFVAVVCAAQVGVAASVVAFGAAEAAPAAVPAAAGAATVTGISHANELGSRMAGYLSAHPWAGYSTSRVDQAANTLTVYGKGAPPAGLVKELAAHQGSSTIKYLAATYTNDELITEERAVLTRMKKAGVTPQSIRPDGQGNGLVVTVAEGTPSAGTARAQTAVAPAQKTALVAAAKSRMPIAVEVQEKQTPEPIRRDSDTIAYYGGALIMRTNADGSKYACSSGVTVFYGAAPNRRYGMITAAHCGESYFYTRADRFVGRTHMINKTADVQMLRIGSIGQPYSNRLFNGAWNAVNSYSVHDSGNPPQGLQLCVSGGKSGTLCGLQVLRTDVMSSNGHGPGFWFQDADNTLGCAVQAGDSGSPVHMPPYSNGSVTIAGIAVAGYMSGARCPEHPIYGGSSGKMYRNGFATRISTVLNVFIPAVGLATNSSGVGGGTG
jgi:hypothetical protein